MNTAVLGGLAFLFSFGVLLQILGCVLYSNWWPLLTAVMYVLLPIPALFFSSGSSMDFLIMPDSSSAGGDWEDAGRFLTGFSAIGSIAIPAVLHHGGLITTGAMLIEFLALVMLASAVVLFIKISHSGYDGGSPLWR